MFIPRGLLALGGNASLLESGKVDIDDLAPRLKELRARQRELDGKKDEALDEVNQTGVGSAGRTRTYDQSVNSRPLYH